MDARPPRLSVIRFLILSQSSLVLHFLAMQITALLGQALLAVSAIAAPVVEDLGKSGIGQRLNPRHLTKPNVLVSLLDTVVPENSSIVASPDSASNDKHTVYSDNWGGAVHSSPPSGSKFTAVSARMTVPKATLPNDGSTQSSASASAWVGIDGSTYTKAILQTGIDLTVDASGAVEYTAWYEWYPDYAYDWTGLEIHAGDELEMSVEATSPNEGTAVINNLSTGQRVSKTLSAPQADATLAGQNAEWIVEKYLYNGQPVRLANFGSVHFTDLRAETSGAGVLNAAGAEMITLTQNGNVVAQAKSPSPTELDVTYVGP